MKFQILPTLEMIAEKIDVLPIHLKISLPGEIIMEMALKTSSLEVYPFTYNSA